MNMTTQESSVEMELLMRGIIVLSILGTALCLVSVSHWDTEVSRAYTTPMHHPDSGIPFTKENPVAGNQPYIPGSKYEKLLAKRWKRAPGFGNPFYKASNDRLKLVDPTYRPDRSKTRWVHPTYKFRPLQRTYRF